MRMARNTRARGHTGCIDGNPAGYVAGRISISQIQLEDAAGRRRIKSIALGNKLLCMAGNR